jgi:hypothetical protein
MHQSTTLALSLLLIAEGPILCHGIEFTAEGQLKYRIHSPVQGRLGTEIDYDFRVEVKDCSWLIRTVPTQHLRNGVPRPLRDYNIAASDQTYFYQLTSLEQLSHSLDRPLPHGTEALPPFTARIGSGSVPYCLSDPTLMVLWYAFGSSCYFQQLTNQLLNPISLPLNQEVFAKDFRVRGLWELHNVKPFLPRWIVFDGVPRFRAAEQASLDVPWHFTNCIYTVEAFDSSQLNAGVPTSFVVRFFPERAAALKDHAETARMECRITMLRPDVRSQEFRPELPGTAVISDLRTISGETPFGVASVSDTWPDAEESKQKAAHLAAATAARDPRVPASVWLAQLLLLAVVTAPVAINIIWRRAKARHAQETR